MLRKDEVETKVRSYVTLYQKKTTAISLRCRASRYNPFVSSTSGAGERQPELQGVRLQASTGRQDRGHLHHAGERK